MIYSKLKIFRYPEKVASLPITEAVTAPLHVRLKPTNACNHRCVYCAYRQPDLQLGEDMDIRNSLSREKMREIVTDLVSMGVKAVTFSGGGEPLVYPHLLEAVQMLQAGGVKFATLTNGSRLSGELADFFARYATWVRVSIDGWDGPSYAKYRGVSEDEFKRVLSNMANFATLGDTCALSVVINVDRDNAVHVGGLIRALDGIGVRSIKVAPVIMSNDQYKNFEYHKPYFDLVYQQVRDAEEFFPYLEISNAYRGDLSSFKKAYTFCYALQIRPVIAADGWVYSCQDRGYTQGGKLFSLATQTFREGWMRGDWRCKINPARDCGHCAMHGINEVLHEYFSLDQEHEAFV